jgi:HEAT repeat protein
MHKILPIITGMTLAFALALGCAPSITHLQKHLDSQNYAEAVAAVAGDEQMETELAALVVERAAGEDPASAAELVDALAASGGPGKRALERIVERGDPPMSLLAFVALERGSAPRQAKELDRYLKNQRSDVRAAAAEAWSGDLSVKRLHDLLFDHDPRVRRAAVNGLAKHTEEDRVSVWLREALRLDPDPKVRAAAARRGKALGKRDKALDTLRQALEDENMGVRLAALRGLGAIGEGEALELLRDRIAGPLSETVVVAAAELARLGEAKGRGLLDEALAAKSPNIRATALTHLGRAGVEDREQIQLEMLADESPQVVLLASSLLLRTDHAEPDGPVAEALWRIADLKVARSDEARDMLAVLGDPKAVADVTAVLADGHDAVMVAVLRRVKRAAALRARFVELLAHGEEAVRLAAARAVLASSLG